MSCKKIKASAFIITAVAVCAALYTFKAPNSEAANKAGKTYGDWKIACEKNQSTKKEVCFAQQSVSVTQDEKQVHIATYQFMYSGNNLKLIEILPQGILLQPGTSIIAGDKIIGNAKFTVCQNNTCLAVADISKDDLSIILKSESVSIGMFNHDAKQANLVLSTKGLQEVLAEIK